MGGVITVARRVKRAVRVALLPSRWEGAGLPVPGLDRALSLDESKINPTPDCLVEGSNLYSAACR